MKVSTLKLSNLRNAEHFEFYTEVRDLINKATSTALGIDKYYPQFNSLLLKEDECLVLVRKSEYTETMREVEKLRDNDFSGMSHVIKGYAMHFDPEMRDAAKRLSILFDTYGNLAARPNNEETSMLYNLIADLESSRYSNEIETLNILSWVRELKKNNTRYDELVKSRYEEKSIRNEKINYKLKDVRVELDGVYKSIVQTIEVLSELSDTTEKIDTYKTFTTHLNVIINDYSTRLAQREGKAEAKKRKEEEENINIDDYIDYLDDENI